MLDLKINDIVVLRRNDGYIRREKVKTISPQCAEAETENLIINLDTLNDIEHTYEVIKVLRPDICGDYNLIWEKGDESFQESENACDISFEVYQKVCKERDELKEVVIEQAKAIYNLMHKE